MKKLLLSTLTVAATLFTAAQTNDFTVEWGKLLDGTTTAGDQGTDIKVDASGNAYWLFTAGTKTDMTTITFGGETLFEGSDYEGTSQNNNFALVKTDAAGNKLWVVYSNSGDCENNAGGLATTSDGGVIAAVKVRHTEGFQDKAINFVDAAGTDVDVEWEEENGGLRAYKLIVLKITTDGHIDWTRIIDFDTAAGPAASGSYSHGFANCFNLGTIATDSNNNIYISLNYRSTVSVGKSDNTIETIKAVNVATWSGDPQTACGDFMLLSLDKDGYYRNNLTLEGSATAAYCQRVIVDGNQVFAQGYINGNGATLTVGGKTLAPASAIINPVVLAADLDLNVQWAKCFPADKVQNKYAFQNVGLNKVGQNLWFVGMYNLKFSDPDDASKYVTSTQGSIREGFIVKLDASTGEWIASRNSRDDDWNKPSAAAKTGLTGYFDVLQNPENPAKIYVFGYVMNVAVGVFLREYDAETLVANLESGQNNVITQGGVPSCQSVAYDAPHGVAYITARGNKAFTLNGNDDKPTPSAWGVLAAKVTLPESMKTSGIESVIVDGVDSAAEAIYYNLQGIRIANPAAGQVYIRVCGNHSDKIVM